MSASDYAIRVHNLGKQYRLGDGGGTFYRYKSLGETLGNLARRPIQTLTAGRGPMTDANSFWALKDVDFEVKKGEVVGIIGRNGAGKSTLLKILSRITKPTTGRIDLYGRVGSLLEVGTGFHPELSGRENIYLNGAILGMTRVEVHSRFDEIVAFSEIEKFLDLPVKQYSSGMYTRLAFAVAAHLEPEILIVDEVLAVGDADFQRKCIGKMQSIAQQGRTVLFVSHNMAAVAKLCTRAILMKDGCVVDDDEVDPILSKYRAGLATCLTSASLVARVDRTGSGSVRLTSWSLEDLAGHAINSVKSGQTFAIVLGFVADVADRKRATVDVGLSFGTNGHELLTVLYASYEDSEFTKLPASGHFRCTIHQLPLVAGSYRLGARVLVDGVEADWPRDGVGQLTVDFGDYYGTGHSGFGIAAPMLLRGDWQMEPVNDLEKASSAAAREADS